MKKLLLLIMSFVIGKEYNLGSVVIDGPTNLEQTDMIDKYHYDNLRISSHGQCIFSNPDNIEDAQAIIHVKGKTVIQGEIVAKDGVKITLITQGCTFIADPQNKLPKDLTLKCAFGYYSLSDYLKSSTAFREKRRACIESLEKTKVPKIAFSRFFADFREDYEDYIQNKYASEMRAYSRCDVTDVYVAESAAFGQAQAAYLKYSDKNEMLKAIYARKLSQAAASNLELSHVRTAEDLDKAKARIKSMSKVGRDVQLSSRLEALSRLKYVTPAIAPSLTDKQVAKTHRRIAFLESLAQRSKTGKDRIYTPRAAAAASAKG